MTADTAIFYIIATISALASGCIHCVLAFQRRKWRGVMILYIGSALIQFWFVGIYTLALLGILPIFGDYIRPVLSLLFLSPALIALLHREE